MHGSLHHFVWPKQGHEYEQKKWVQITDPCNNQANQSKQGERENISCSLSNLVQGVDPEKGHLICLTRKGSFQVILYKMIRFLSGKLKEHTKLAKIVKISIFVNRLVFLTDLVIP